MNKRSAMVLAGGLAAVLLAGSAALSLGLLGARPAAAGGEPPAPRVRTVERTVTIHEQDRSGATVYAVAAPAAGVSEADGDDGAEVEDEGAEVEDEGFEDEGFEDD